MSDKVTHIGSHLREASPAKRSAGGGHLPEDCPVTPLGKNGLLCHYLDASGSYVALECKAHSKNTLYGLFGQRAAFMIGPRAWAKGMDEKTGRPKDFAPDKVARDLIAACDAEGPFSGPEALRGNGAWLGEDGSLLVHNGDHILNGRVSERPGKRDRHIYVRRPTRTAPATQAQPGGDEGPAAELGRLLRCWNWRRPELDVQLMIGAIAAAWLCGALDVRPQIWITGERGSGKSTLMKKLLAQVLHEGQSCAVSDDPTPAGVRARMAQDAIAFMFDEAEPSEDNSKLNGIIELARSAFSGGSSLRSTENHGTVMHVIRFCGFFSSILRPSFKTQDLSRIAPFMLRKNSGRPPQLASDSLWLLGRRLHRRMIDQWPEYQRRLVTWREQMMSVGLDGRGADLYGTLLAAGDVAMHDAPPDGDTLTRLSEAVAEATRADRAEEEPEWSRCLGHLRTSAAPQLWRGGLQGDIGSLIAQAAQRRMIRDENGEMRRTTAAEAADAQRALAGMGLAFVPMLDAEKKPVRDAKTGDPVGHLAVANSHATLASLMARTPWAARAGAAGAWKAALEEAPQAKLSKERRFGGSTSRCVLVPLELVLGVLDEGVE